jgi:hypothetical protein
MPRLTSALLLGAGVLVTTWVSAPAAPTAPPVRVSAEDLAEIAAMAPIAAEVEQEVDRLRAQLAAVPQMPSPTRDPFSFGAPRPSPRPRVVAPADDLPIAETAVDAAPALVWPTLTAVMAESPGWTAVIAWGDSIEFLKSGDSYKDFRVVSVSGTSIEVHHVPSNTTKTLTLR